MLAELERVFGPYPFPETRLAIVETLSLSSANATWTGLSSNLMCPKLEDSQSEDAERILQHASRVLSHELGHSWWGQGLSVRSWEDIWLHESFSSYGELMVLRALHGEERQHFAYQSMVANVSPKARLRMSGRAGRSAHTASHRVLWFKGPWVLRTLQYEVGDDPTWFRSLANFQAQHRFQTVTTQDFIDTLETTTERPWTRFFQEWFEGQAFPRIRGAVQVQADGLLLRVDNFEDEIRSFHVPIELTWTEGSEARRQRILLEPGKNEIRIKARAPEKVAVEGLENVLGLHHVRVVQAQ